MSQTGPPVGAAYDKVTYDPAFAAEEAAAGATSDPVVESKLRIKRDVNDPCSVNPNGYGPVSDPDTYASFMSDSQFGAIANAAVVPQGYSLSYSNMNGSAQGNGYMGLYTLQSFDTIKCQQYCDAAFSCYAINVYMERDPKYNPADSCPNPQSTTNFKCTLWGLPLTDTGATGQGQYRNQFRIGIRGSNGMLPIFSVTPFFFVTAQFQSPLMNIYPDCSKVIANFPHRLHKTALMARLPLEEPFRHLETIWDRNTTLVSTIQASARLRARLPQTMTKNILAPTALMTPATSSTPLSYPRITNPKEPIAPCILRRGTRAIAPTLASTMVVTIILSARATAILSILRTRGPLAARLRHE